MMRYLMLLLVVTPLFADEKPKMTTVPSMDLAKFLGAWHEIQRVPNSFQDNTRGDFGPCLNTIARYTKTGETSIDVANTCTRKNKLGETQEETAKAVGTVVPETSNSKLKVNFTGMAMLRALGIGDGDYWILGLGPENSQAQYSWVLVGSPGLKYGWVLARNTSLSEKELTGIFSIAEAQGYERKQFISARD